MGQCGGAQQNPEKGAQIVLNKTVQEEIEKDKQSSSKKYKLLLLGAGNSGKSTFFKQLCQIHGDGLSDEDKQNGSRYIHDSIIHQMQNIIEACKEEFKFEVSTTTLPSLEIVEEMSREQKITRFVKATTNKYIIIYIYI
ncbi:hypothetical protein RFI_03045 [Reticulomyxa filosa]|uniref:G domain-containing protein n=1 Tax=Reticulomyxa filosa TaxID=46433 RepID=X6P7K9_RETFI|nr:hypothetical protein RFI_03045 [Reticulomyxa filosa]|eukprot:ETO34049.1 hypothetical protein RFI_03045 [Reticulomyxa filosa]